MAFFAEKLVHTKGRWARRKFVLEDWQEHDIIRPLFGEVVWSPEWRCYVRRYRIAYIVLARKCGKSELAAGIALYLLEADDEEAAEVYGAAKDTKQAGKVWEPAKRMRDLSPDLAERLKVNRHSRRIFNEITASYYEIITSDAAGELGHNPHGFVLDEVLSQADDSLFNAMRTAMGTLLQALMLLITTETNDPFGFGAQQIDEAERVQADPPRAPHIFAYVRKLPSDEQALDALRHQFPGHPDLPVSADPWDERNWRWPNPALGSFLSLEALRQEAVEAKNQPARENSFRQFRLNQRVAQASRFMQLHLWDRTAGIVVEDQLRGRRCFGGLDLAVSVDIAALCWDFPAEDGSHDVIWRFWLPEERLGDLDRRTAGQASVWARDGFLTLTPADTIDYKAILHQVDLDAQAFDIVELAYDRWGMTQLSQDLTDAGMTVVPITQGMASMSPPLREWERVIYDQKYRHGGNPAARWQVDNLVVISDTSGNIRPDKGHSADKIDGVVAAVMALDRATRHQSQPLVSKVPVSL